MGSHPVLVDQPLTIPDDLLAWARQPDVRVRMRVDYAAKLDELLSDNETLAPRDTIRLLDLLEGLCCEAIRHERDDLLIGFDMFTAEWLGLHFELSDKTVVGRNGNWNWDEMRAVLACQTPTEAMAFASEVKDLVTDVFPEARIGAIIDAEAAKPACAGCGMSSSTVMLTMESGSQYCSTCWSDMTQRFKLAQAGGRKRR